MVASADVDSIKLSETVDEHTARLNQLRDTVAKAEDAIFSDFCKRIGVRNIREYESKQLKEMQELGSQNLVFEKTIARLRNKYVLDLLSDTFELSLLACTVKISRSTS